MPILPVTLPSNWTDGPRIWDMLVYAMSRGQQGSGCLTSELRDLCLHYVMRALPTGVCSALGAWLSTTLGQRRYPVANARARDLLGGLRPDLAATPAMLEANLHLLWRNVGRAYAEFAVISRILRAGRMPMCGRQRLDAALAGNRPLIVCFVHLGNWEVLGHQLASHPLITRERPVAAVVMPPVNRAHAKIAEHCRGSLPVELVSIGPHVWRNVHRTLRRPDGVIWIAADEVANGRVFAPHFGRRPRIDGNLGKIVRLAAATGALVLPTYSERTEPARFQSHILPLLEIPQGQLTDEMVREQVMRIDAIFAPIVRRLLTQWYMAVEFSADPDDPVMPDFQERQSGRALNG